LNLKKVLSKEDKIMTITEFINEAFREQVERVKKNSMSILFGHGFLKKISIKNLKYNLPRGIMINMKGGYL